MLKLQFNGDVLVVQPEGRITQEDLVTLTRWPTNISPATRRLPA
jgi:hypothetical protein